MPVTRNVGGAHGAAAPGRPATDARRGSAARRQARGDRPNPSLGAQIRQTELAFILGQGPGAGPDPAPQEDHAPWGIALSGGGIRSATFSLGVLQALASNGLLRCFHYQSTVSGGGYAGAFLQGLIRRGGVQAAFDVLASHVGDAQRQKPILHLRQYSNYLSPRKQLLSGDTMGMVGTYVRNVVLIQIQLLALMVALSLLPLLAFPYLRMLGGATGTLACLLGAGICGVVAASLLESIGAHNGATVPPSDEAPSNPAGGPRTEQPQDQVLRRALAIVYLVAAAAILGALGLWLPSPGQGDEPGAAWNLYLAAAISGGYLAVWMLWLASAAVGHRGVMASPTTDPLQARSPHAMLRFVAATMAAALLAGPVLIGLRMLLSHRLAGNPLYIITFGPSCVLAGVMLTGIVHVGLAGSALTDLEREMWARVAGKAVATVLALAIALVIVNYGPWLMLALWSKSHAILLPGLLSTATWIATTGTGVLAAYSQKVGGLKTRSLPLSLLARVAPGIFLVGLLVAVSLATQSGLRQLVGLPCPSAGCGAHSYMADLMALAGSRSPWIPLALAGAVLIWALFGLAIDLNEFSMNAFYRNRLVRCYLGASRERNPEPTTNFDPGDDMSLAEVARVKRDADNTRPLYPLIGATLNLVDAKQLDWQDRKAASFVFSPGFCGYVPPPSQKDATAIGDVRGLWKVGDADRHASSLPEVIRLGSAMAISGAAVSPNMGYHSSPAVTLLLTLFDARLGWWLPNPRRRPGSRRAPQITFYGGWLVREMLGRTREEGDFIYLSDGGHFENLGIYELVRRQCEFILCIDSSADPGRCFADLGNAIQKCRTDFGAEIDIDVSDLRCGPDGISKRYCAVGRITYWPDRTATDTGAASGAPKTGVLLYVKPSMTGCESADVAYYASMHPSFPHESTADQYFDESQFESYRRLGRGIGSIVFDRVIERAQAESNIPACASGFGLRQSDLKASFLRELQYEWVAPLKGMEEHFSKHAHAMGALFAKLRREPSLSALDAHLYPAWSDMARGTPKQDPSQLTALPGDNDFRACFYFCQELVQLMESIYHDLDLEHAWNHPDNRGWLNAFRQWSWSPVFRIAWAAGSATYGKPFVTFCELHLGLPALEKSDFTEIEVHPIAPGTSWCGHCGGLLAERRINALEHSILMSPALAPVENLPDGHVVLLRLKWSSITVRTACPLGNTTVAMAVLACAVLRVFRVQDHVRHMGLASVFMRHMVERNLAFEGVDIQAGDYGEVGVYTPSQAAACTRRLIGMLRHAQSASAAEPLSQ